MYDMHLVIKDRMDAWLADLVVSVSVLDLASLAEPASPTSSPSKPTVISRIAVGPFTNCSCHAGRQVALGHR